LTEDKKKKKGRKLREPWKTLVGLGMKPEVAGVLSGTSSALEDIFKRKELTLPPEVKKVRTVMKTYETLFNKLQEAYSTATREVSEPFKELERLKPVFESLMRASEQRDFATILDIAPKIESSKDKVFKATKDELEKLRQDKERLEARIKGLEEYIAALLSKRKSDYIR